MAIKHDIVSKDDWLRARKKLLAKEKKFLRMQEALGAERRSLEAMSNAARMSCLSYRAQLDPTDTTQARLFRAAMEFEHAFSTAGGLLAEPDPTGAGDVMPGFGDQREIELLVKAGFLSCTLTRPRTFMR